MTFSEDQSMRAVIMAGKWLLKKAMACSGSEKIALKNASFGCATKSVPVGNSSISGF